MPIVLTSGACSLRLVGLACATCPGSEPSGGAPVASDDEELERGGALNGPEARAPGRELPRARPFGRPDVVTRFFDSVPTGVTVSASGRIFVNFPRWVAGTPVSLR